FHGKVVVEAARALQHASGNLVSVFLIDSTAWTGTFHGIRQTALRNLRRTWRGISTGPADDTPYTKSLSASLRDSWRLLQWLLAQAPPGMKRRLKHAAFPNADVDDANGFVDEEGKPVGLADMYLLFRIRLPGATVRPGCGPAPARACGGDRETIRQRQGVRGPANALGGRAHYRLAKSPPSSRQGFREPHRQRAGVPAARLHPSHAAQALQSLIGFPDGLLEIACQKPAI